MQQLKDCFEDGDPFINDESLCNTSWSFIKADISCLQQNNFLDQWCETKLILAFQTKNNGTDFMLSNYVLGDKI